MPGYSRPGRHTVRPPMALCPAAVRIVLVAFVSSLATAAPAATPDAGAADAATPALLKAALVLQTFDHFDTACRRGAGPSGAQREALERWRLEQRVDAARERVATLRDRPALQQQVERGAAQVIAQLRPMGSDPCLAAVSISRTDDARFASTGLVAAGPASPSPSPSPSSGPPAASPPPPRATPSRPVASGQGGISAVGEDVLARIEGFAFGTRAGIGYGGMVTLEVYPIAMFRNGDALQDVAALAFPPGLGC